MNKNITTLKDNYGTAYENYKKGNFKTAEKTLKPIVEQIEKNVSKLDGTFKFSREESKKTGEG